MRSKEDAKDYRYFPDPDLVPIEISDEWMDKVRAAQPEFRDEKKVRYKEEYDLPDYDIDIITGSKHLADIFEVLKTKDYMLNPKVNGYRSYHLIVRVPIFLSDRVVPTKVEIQIRTVAMDFWASLEHKIYYKYEGNTPEYIKKELKECADLVTFLDSKMLAINEEVRSIREENRE